MIITEELIKKMNRLRWGEKLPIPLIASRLGVSTSTVSKFTKENEDDKTTGGAAKKSCRHYQ